MIVDIELAGKQHRVEVSRSGDRDHWIIDRRAVEADVLEITPGLFSILLGEKSIEVCVEPTMAGARVTVGGRDFDAAFRDPRVWQRGRHGAAETEGRQQISAPMPGKVVRLLVAAGDTVQAGQGLMVVEAMKMQNEIRSPKSGTVERISVVEGQTVNAGEGVAIIA